MLSGGRRRLRIIADIVVEKAEQGDLQAAQMIADRLDGKAVQKQGDVPVDPLWPLLLLTHFGPDLLLFYIAPDAQHAD